MAIYGVGAFYDDTTDVSSEFMQRGVACVGWPPRDAPALQQLLRQIKTGDVIYIKAHPAGRRLTVKAVGIVEDSTIARRGRLGNGVRVRWIWRGPKEVLQETPDEKYNVRNNTLYEEFSPAFQRRILQLLFSAIH